MAVWLDPKTRLQAAVGGEATERSPQSPELVTIVVPAFNEAANLDRLYQRICTVLAELPYEFELIIVDDGGTDDTLEVAKRLRHSDKRVHYISFSRNFGHQSAIVAGLEHSRGTVVISMDADLQHPPELLPQMIELWREGYDVIYTTKRSDVSSRALQRALVKVFYCLFNHLSGMKLGLGQSDFRLLDRRVVDIICQLPERGKFLRGVVDWLGYRQIGLEYDVPPRYSGRSTYRFGRRVAFHLDAFLWFSVFPLRVLTISGALLCALSVVYAVYAAVMGLYGLATGYRGGVVPGWASVAVFVTFLGGVQLLGIGLLGEYIARIFEQIKSRPVFLVRETSLRGSTQRKE